MGGGAIRGHTRLVEWAVLNVDDDALFRRVASELLPDGDGLSVAAGLSADGVSRVLLLRRRKGNYGPRVTGLPRLPVASFGDTLD